MTSTFKKTQHFSDNKGITLVGDIYQVTAADVNNPVRVNYNEVWERSARLNMDGKEK